ncbi:MAG: squalene synthase HpnC [Planctomycetota bacterium]
MRAVDLLHWFGPQRCAEVGREAAWDYVRRLAWKSDENFSVLSALVPERLRDGFAAVYAYCRWSDDLADETGFDESARVRSLELLAWWRGELHRAFEGDATHPVFVPLAEVVHGFGLAREPFDHLLDAFEQDQRVSRYKSWDEVLDYCRHSADPVGRIVLALGGVGDGSGDHELYRLSDATCTALQLINFWQDVRRDLLERDRVYIPADDTAVTESDLRTWMERDRPEEKRVYSEAIAGLCERTEALFVEGRALPMRLRSTPAAELAPAVRLFGMGGEAILARVRATGCLSLWERPKLGKIAKGSLVLRAAVSRLLPPGGAAA